MLKVHHRDFGFVEAEKLAIAAADDRQELLFLPAVRLAHENDELPPIKRLGRRLGFVELLIGLGELGPRFERHDDSRRPCAMHISRALVAKSSFALSSAVDDVHLRAQFLEAEVLPGRGGSRLEAPENERPICPTAPTESS